MVEGAGDIVEVSAGDVDVSTSEGEARGYVCVEICDFLALTCF